MVLGCDVSFYQDNNETPQKIDFVKMKAAGASFVICRAGQNSWVDPDFADYWTAAKNAGLLRGSYWYFDSRYDPIKQAELFVDTLGADTGELPMFADIEENYGGSYEGQANWKIFVERIRQLRPQKQVGIYTAFYYWRDNTSLAYRDYFKQYPLWVANYGVSSPSVPPAWTSWEFWQFTDHGDGLKYGVESLGIDLNYYNGTIDQLYEKYGSGTVPPVPPPPDMDIDYPFPGVTRKRGDGVQVLIVAPDSIDKVEIV